MTWDDVLKMGCTEAGLSYYEISEVDAVIVGEAGHVEPQGDGSVLLSQPLGAPQPMTMAHPALPTYVAELLVAMLPLERYDERLAYSGLLLKLHGSGSHFAPAFTRILAALVALGKLTLEQAQEIANEI